MKVVIAIDSMKGSLTSIEAGNAAAEGVERVYKNAQILVKPLADGGEGTVETLIEGMGGTLHTVSVTGPLHAKVSCRYGILENTKTAVLEMAGAAGLTLLPEAERNPLHTTTYGVGEVIRDAIKKGCRRFIVGIGGSATNDGGVGMLQALGYDFLDKKGDTIPWGAKGLEVLDHIEEKNVIPQLKECRFYIACDVANPLCGPDGCSRIYGPQKGASQEMTLKMDQWMEHYARIAKKYTEKADPDHPGAGAAGGMGFAFMAFTNGTLKSGIHIVLEETGLEKEIQDADIVLTGEGRLDGQTAMGKAPVGVAELAKKYGIPVVAVAGSVTEDAVACNERGIDAFFPILRGVSTLEEAVNPQTAKKNMSDTVEQIFRLWKVVHG